MLEIMLPAVTVPHYNWCLIDGHSFRSMHQTVTDHMHACTAPGLIPVSAPLIFCLERMRRMLLRRKRMRRMLLRRIRMRRMLIISHAGTMRWTTINRPLAGILADKVMKQERPSTSQERGQKSCSQERHDGPRQANALKCELGEIRAPKVSDQSPNFEFTGRPQVSTISMVMSAPASGSIRAPVPRMLVRTAWSQ